MSPYICATESHDDENSSPRMDSPKPKGRVLYCRKCEGHGEKVILKNHSPQCPYILCNCKSCEKLNYKRLKSFNKRNKEKIELAAALNAKRHATNDSGSGSGFSDSFEDEEGCSRRSSFSSSSKTSSPGMDSERNASTTPSSSTSQSAIKSPFDPAPSSSSSAAGASSDIRASQTSNSAAPSSSSSTGGGLEGRSMSLGAMTVMSYDIWKAKCASERKRLEEERVKKNEIEILDSSPSSATVSRGISSSPKQRSPSPIPMRKRAHTFAQSMTSRTEDIPVVATKKMSVDEGKGGKGRYILLPTIPAMRIYVNEDEEANRTNSTTPSTSNNLLPQPRQFNQSAPSIVNGVPLRPSPIQQQHHTIPSMAAPLMPSPFKPVAISPMATSNTHGGISLPMSTMSMPIVSTTTTSAGMPVMTPHVGVAGLPTTMPTIPTMSNMSTEQIISSLTLHNTVMQQQQNNQLLQELLNNLANGGNANSNAIPVTAPPPPPSAEMLSMIRLQQQAAALAAALQVSGVNIGAGVGVSAATGLLTSTASAIQKPVPTTQNLLSTFLNQSPIYSHPV